MIQFFFSFQKRQAETVDEEENTEAVHKVQHQEKFAAVDAETDQGGETGEAVNGNGHEMEEDQAAQDEPSHAQGGTNEENGEEMDQNVQEERKEVIDDQTQVTCLCSFVMIMLPICFGNRSICRMLEQICLLFSVSLISVI